MEDALIVELYWQRDEQAIQETAQKYAGRLCRIASNVLQDPEVVKECENDTYLAAWNSIPPNRPDKYLFAYLAKIMRNRALDRCAEQARQKRNALVVELTAEMEACIPGADNIEQTLHRKELAQAISAFLRQQTKERRDVFLRRYWYMDSVGEIAKRYHFSQSKVKALLMRTRNDLKNYLEKEEHRI